MVKKEQIQDPSGNIIYWHTSSDVVFDEDTGNSVKQDIDAIKRALGISGSSVTNINIDADTLQGYEASDFVLEETYSNVIKTINKDLEKKAPLDSPVFTGMPTAPDVEAGDASEKIANTNFVKLALENALKTCATKEHTHAASGITAGTFKDTGVLAKNGSDYSTSRIRNISLVSELDTLPTGLEDGSIVMVYSES